MASGCPICETELSPGASRCPECGFPAALAVDALHALEREDPAAAPAEDRPPPASRSVARPTPPPDGQAEAVARVARDLDSDLALLQRLGGESPEAASAMRQAALTQVDGRPVEALGLLREALGRVGTQTRDLFDQRIHEIEVRQAALRKDGVGISLGTRVAEIHSDLDSGRLEEAIERLVGVDRDLTRVESDWKGLRGLLRQIDELRSSAAFTGERIEEVEQDIAKIRELLAQPTLTSETLDQSAQVAARALMLLHEAIPGFLQRELDRHSEALEEFPEEHAQARAVRGLHAEATRHLRRGKIPEATARLRELRQAIRELGSPPAPVAPLPVPAVAAPGAGSAAAVGVPSVNGPSPPAAAAPDDSGLVRLLEKARRLAARVRTLPAESEIAYEAAVQIRAATELLRSRKLEEADTTLTRLMRTLDAERPA